MVIEFKSGIVPAAPQVKALATAIGIVFLAEGVVNAFVSLAHRSTRGWGWGLANGLVTLVLGAMILSMGPACLLSVIGLLVGISVLFQRLRPALLQQPLPSAAGVTQAAAAGPRQKREAVELGLCTLGRRRWRSVS